jgi:broad specificity phosphatase PhoE
MIIIFETHSTTMDNEAGIASGWDDVSLSELCIQQAKNLGTRYAGQSFDGIFCSDLQRSHKTAELAFGNTLPIIRDVRLRECDYGHLTRKSAEHIASEKMTRIHQPFPNGESYVQVAKRIKSFLDGAKADYDAGQIMVIGHRATQYGLEHWCLNKPIGSCYLCSLYMATRMDI